MTAASSSTEELLLFLSHFLITVSVDLQEPAYKNPRLALWSASKNGLGWLGLTLARASKNIQASLGWRKNRQCQ